MSVNSTTFKLKGFNWYLNTQWYSIKWEKYFQHYRLGIRPWKLYRLFTLAVFYTQVYKYYLERLYLSVHVFGITLFSQYLMLFISAYRSTPLFTYSSFHMCGKWVYWYYQSFKLLRAPIMCTWVGWMHLKCTACRKWSLMTAYVFQRERFPCE